jgi:hypothetical protein
MSDISDDPRYRPVLDALIRLHGSQEAVEGMRQLERGMVAEFLTMLDAASLSVGAGSGALSEPPRSRVMAALEIARKALTLIEAQPNQNDRTFGLARKALADIDAIIEDEKCR